MEKCNFLCDIEKFVLQLILFFSEVSLNIYLATMKREL